MQFSRLSELISEEFIAEDKATDEIDAIRKLVSEAFASMKAAAKAKNSAGVEEALDDLKGEIGDGGSLESLMKSSGALSMDYIADDDGQTSLTMIQKATETLEKEVSAGNYKNIAAVERKVMNLLDEIDMMVSSGMNEEVLVEAKAEYEDSADFTEDFYSLSSHVNNLEKIVKTPKFKAWMHVTDTNFGTECESKAANLSAALSNLKAALNDLEEELENAA